VRQRADGSVELVDVTDESELLVHNAHHVEPSAAFALSRLTQSTANATPVGIFRDVERPVYDDLMAEQLATASAKQQGDLAALLQAGDTWTI
jgi:2-oxoglutarate ferredoxin oxidoreductase subunit beta